MTPQWKADVRAAMSMRGVSEQWLADQISQRRGVKIKRDTINKLLRKQKSSSLVPDICSILGLAPPMIATPSVPDEKTKRAIDLVLRASPELRDAVILLLEASYKQN